MQGRRTEAKLGDLGLAKLIPDGHLALQHTLPGTPAYSAPEVVQAQLSWRLRTQGRRDQFHTQASHQTSGDHTASLLFVAHHHAPMAAWTSTNRPILPIMTFS